MRIAVGSGPCAIAYGGGQVWVANNLDGTVSRIDAASGSLTGTYPVGAAPNGIAVTPDAVWVSDEVDGTIVRVDPTTGAVTSTVLGGRPEGVAVANGSRLGWRAGCGRWLTAAATSASLTPLFDYIDPALAYYAGTWDIISVTHDGLVGFKRVGGVDGNTLVPDLAASLPRPSDGGRTYSFQLRSGIRFSNGKERNAGRRACHVRAAVFRAYGFDEQHAREPSPRLDFYSGIVGAQPPASTQPKTCDLSRGIVTSDADRTVTFHLVAPDPEFLYKLAVPFASIVPQGHAVGGTEPVPEPARTRSPRSPAPLRPSRAQPALPRLVAFGAAGRAARHDRAEHQPRERQRRTGRPHAPPSSRHAAGRIDVPEAGVPADLLTRGKTQLSRAAAHHPGRRRRTG